MCVDLVCRPMPTGGRGGSGGDAFASVDAGEGMPERDAPGAGGAPDTEGVTSLDAAVVDADVASDVALDGEPPVDAPSSGHEDADRSVDHARDGMPEDASEEGDVDVETDVPPWNDESSTTKGEDAGRDAAVQDAAAAKTDGRPGDIIREGGAPGGSLLAPTDFPEEIVFWLDGEDLTQDLTSGLQVWRDKGARHNDFTQPDSSQRPSVLTSEGRRMAHFTTAATLWAQDGSATRPKSMTLAIVCRSYQAGHPIIGFSTSTDLSNLPFPFWHWVFFHNGDNRIDVTMSYDFVAGPIDQSWDWGTLGVFIYRTQRHDVFRNGKSLFAFEAPGLSPEITYPVLRNLGVMVGNFEGDVAEVVAFDGTLTDDEVAAASNYLTRKWKVSGQ